MTNNYLFLSIAITFFDTITFSLLSIIHYDDNQYINQSHEYNLALLFEISEILQNVNPVQE